MRRVNTLLCGLGVVIVMGLGSSCQRSDQNGGTSVNELARALPEQVSSWHRNGDPHFYSPQSLFDYIDGHAELYLAYGLTASLAQRYSTAEGSGDVVVDVFKLACPADAFGVFTHDLDGEEIAIGQGALFRYGWLSLWQGPFFVSIYAEEESDAARQAVLELGRTVAAAIPEIGAIPPIVQELPPEGLVRRTARYLHHPTVLAAHCPLYSEDILQLGQEGVVAALGRYERPEGRAYLLLLSYPDSELAAAATTSFAALYLDEGHQISTRDNGWYAIASRNGDEVSLACVLGASSQSLAASLLDDAGAVSRKEPS